MSGAEQSLWRHLRRHPLADCRFCWRHPVGPFIANFACITERFIVEIDGGQHRQMLDASRDPLDLLLKIPSDALKQDFAD
jgi:very-short-patch-repair endonuclease